MLGIDMLGAIADEGIGGASPHINFGGGVGSGAMGPLLSYSVPVAEPSVSVDDCADSVTDGEKDSIDSDTSEEHKEGRGWLHSADMILASPFMVILATVMSLMS